MIESKPPIRLFGRQRLIYSNNLDEKQNEFAPLTATFNCNSAIEFHDLKIAFRPLEIEIAGTYMLCIQ